MLDAIMVPHSKVRQVEEQTMKIAYIRTSTTDQKNSLKSQEEVLRQAGCEKLFIEEASAVGKRPILEEALDFLRDGDQLCVKSMDRLARSVSHMVEISSMLEKKNVHLNILNMGIDTTTPTGKLMLNLITSINQFERELLLERQAMGIEAAKKQGKYKGRKPLSEEVKNEVLTLIGEGLQKRQVSQQMKLSENTIYRIIRESKQAA
jgi:DNA invertase Pin-like site-specific DNA recombinase